LKTAGSEKLWRSTRQRSAIHGRLTRRGAGGAWKALGTRKGVGIVFSYQSSANMESQPDRSPAPVRSGQALQGVGIKTSAFRQFAQSRMQ
jgi:hypothetical protein